MVGIDLPPLVEHSEFQGQRVVIGMTVEVMM